MIPGRVLDLLAEAPVTGLDKHSTVPHATAKPRPESWQPLETKELWRMNRPPEFDAEFRSELRDLMVWRRDVRRFKRDPLPDGALERLLELACLSPSVGLSQPWRFVIVDSAARRDAIRECFKACNAEALAEQVATRTALYARLKLEGLDDAPCHVAVFADRETSQGHGLGRLTMPEMIEYSAVLAIHTLWLGARAEGIGVGWLSILNPQRVMEILDVPRRWNFVGYLCVGYPSEMSDTPLLEEQGWEARRPVSEAVLRR
jgi:5,6-dimethylbenzimidazole synthase